MAACWWPRWPCSCFSLWSPAAAGMLVRRKLMARALVGAAPPDRDRGDAARPRLGDVDGGSLWLLRRLVLTEVIIAVAVLAITALLGIAMPPRPA
jgi:hypothetical protein